MNFTRKGRKYSPEEVFQHVIKAKANATPQRVDFDGDLINIRTLRLFAFKEKGLTCVKCGITGVFFCKERSIKLDPLNNNQWYHFNLYGHNAHGTEVLMTVDHIVPKAKGGYDSIDNLQTMCYKCNNKKGAQGEPERRLRKKVWGNMRNHVVKTLQGRGLYLGVLGQDKLHDNTSVLNVMVRTITMSIIETIYG
jgi:hypothetical protein